jgi:hypothetical protein
MGPDSHPPPANGDEVMPENPPADDPVTPAQKLVLAVVTTLSQSFGNGGENVALKLPPLSDTAVPNRIE